jgi:hypothetical protein
MNNSYFPFFLIFLIWFCSKPICINAQSKEWVIIREFLGSLSNELNVLFAAEGHTLISTARSCSNLCKGDRRCIGLEICKIREDLYRCRACCNWKKLGKEKANINLDNCGFFQQVCMLFNVPLFS